VVANVTALFCCGPWGTLASSQSDAVEYFKKNLIKKYIYFRMLPDLACTGSSQLHSTPRCDPHVPLSFRLRGQLDSVTNVRVTTFRTVRPASEDMMTPEDNPLTIVSLYTRLQIYTELA
jgi:hypothetical protein